MDKLLDRYQLEKVIGLLWRAHARAVGVDKSIAKAVYGCIEKIEIKLKELND